jgi:hypothetical protein
MPSRASNCISKNTAGKFPAVFELSIYLVLSERRGGARRETGSFPPTISIS